MIRFTITDGTKNVFIAIGLSDKDMIGLVDWSPLLIKNRDMELSHDVILFFGETEQNLFDQLRMQGIISAEAKITKNIDRAGN